jgi:hypothetical protein
MHRKQRNHGLIHDTGRRRRTEAGHARAMHRSGALCGRLPIGSAGSSRRAKAPPGRSWSGVRTVGEARESGALVGQRRKADAPSSTTSGRNAAPPQRAAQARVNESSRRRRAKGFANSTAATSCMGSRKERAGRAQRAVGLNGDGTASCGRRRHRWRARLCGGN